MRDQFNQTNFGFFQIKLIYKFWWHIVVVVVCCAGLGDQWVCCQAHYDSWCAWLLLIQQSRASLKLLTVVTVTISLGKASQVLAILLKKKFSLCGCWAISLKYLKQWPLRSYWLKTVANFNLVNIVDKLVQLNQVAFLSPVNQSR